METFNLHHIKLQETAGLWEITIRWVWCPWKEPELWYRRLSFGSGPPWLKSRIHANFWCVENELGSCHISLRSESQLSVTEKKLKSSVLQGSLQSSPLCFILLFPANSFKQCSSIYTGSLLKKNSRNSRELSLDPGTTGYIFSSSHLPVHWPHCPLCRPNEANRAITADNPPELRSKAPPLISKGKADQVPDVGLCVDDIVLCYMQLSPD